MNSHPLISVIIPVYNVGKYIRKSCKSIFSQTYDNYEVILVNDGTTDDSIEIVRGMLDGKFAFLKDRVKIINQENSGLPAARRTGLAHARGEYVIQFDPDDRVSKRILEKMVAAAVKNDADIVICNYFNVYRRYWMVPRREKYYPDKLDCLEAMFSHRHFRAYLWDKLVRRSLFEGGILIPRYAMCEDMIIVSQLILKAKTICHIRNRLYFYNKVNPTSISNAKKRKTRDREVILNKLELWDYLEARGNNPLAPIRESYMIHIAWMALCNHETDILEQRPGLLEEVRAYPVSKKYSLELRSQAELKKRIALYGKNKFTGDTQ